MNKRLFPVLLFPCLEIWEPEYIQIPKDVEEELKFEPNMKGKHPSLTLDDKTGNELADREDSEDTRDHNNPSEDSIEGNVDHDDMTSYQEADSKIDDGSKDDEFGGDDDQTNNIDDYVTDKPSDDDDNDELDIDNDDDGGDDDDLNDDNILNIDMEGPSIDSDKDRMMRKDREDLLNDKIIEEETKIPNLNLLDVDKEDRIVEHVYKVMERKKRAVKEQWRNSLHGTKESQGTDKLLTSDVWEDVTDEELENIQKQQYIRLAKYIGWTLLSVIFFVLVGICFLRDPMACIFSFGTCCPCWLIICPCIRGFVRKHLDFKKMVREAMNKYTPGVIVHDDGSLQHYEPTAEEVEYLKELLDELSGQTIV